MNKYSYDDYIKNCCHPVGFNEAVGQYYFGQTSVDILLNKISDLQAKVKELPKKIVNEIIDKYNLNNEPRECGFGDVQYGYVMISTKPLKQFLDKLLKKYEDDAR